MQKRKSGGDATNTNKKDTVSFVLRIDGPLHRRLKHLAVDRKMSLNGICVLGLREWFDRQPEHNSYDALEKKRVK